MATNAVNEFRRRNLRRLAAAGLVLAVIYGAVTAVCVTLVACNDSDQIDIVKVGYGVYAGCFLTLLCIAISLCCYDQSRR